MKTRFDISQEIFCHKNLQEDYDYYDEFFKPDGYVLDKNLETVYKDLELPIILNKGDIVELYGFERIIEHKCYDVINNIMIYTLVFE